MKHDGPHKYQRVIRKTLKPTDKEGVYKQIPSDVIMKCMLPDCPHFLPQLTLAVGRLSLCWGNCGTAVQLTTADLRRKQPLCQNCRAARVERARKLKEIA